ncbi:MAG: hypothetical protein ACJA1A_002807 [Saprospiraceae bacterium]|mgnify:CR=1 FL=1|jgi:hypothetical protein
MRIFVLFLSFFWFCQNLSAQIKWILEPTQDNNQFITPEIDLFNIVIVKFFDRTTKVVDPKGNTIFERDKYLWPISFSSSQKLLAFSKKNESRQYYNTEYKLINEGFEKSKKSRGYNTIITTKNGFLGLIDLNGKVLIDNKYRLLKRIAIGKFKAVSPDGKETILMIDDYPEKNNDTPSCKIATNTFYRAVGRRTNGSLISCIGIINSKGDTLLRHGEYHVKFMPNCPKLLRDSLIIVQSQETDKYGILNIEGDLLIKCEHNSISELDESNPFVNLDRHKSEAKILDLRTMTASNYGYEQAYASEFNIIVQNGKEKGLIDFDGKELFPPLYHSIIERDNKIIFKRNDSIFVYSKTSNSFAQDTFTTGGHRLGKYHVLGRDKNKCLYDVVNLKPITDMKYSKISKLNRLYVCEYKSTDTLYYNPPKERKNIDGEVVKIHYRTSNSIYYEYRDSVGALWMGPTKSKLKKINKTYCRQSISKDSVAFVNTKTLEVQKFLKSYADISCQSYSECSAILHDKKYFLLDHFLDYDLDAIPYDYLNYDKRTGIYIYRLMGKFGLLDKNRIITKANFDGLSLRSDYRYIVELDNLYGILEVEK